MKISLSSVGSVYVQAYIWLLGVFTPRPHQALRHGLRWGFRPQYYTPVPTLPPNPGYKLQIVTKLRFTRRRRHCSFRELAIYVWTLVFATTICTRWY